MNVITQTEYKDARGSGVHKNQKKQREGEI